MTVHIYWWALPLLIFAIGLGWGIVILNQDEGGYFNFNPLIGIGIIVFASMIATAIIIGYFLGRT